MKTLQLAALFAGLIIIAPTASADIIEMQGGSKQEGLILRDIAAENQVTLRTASGDIAIPRSKIAKITKESEAAGQVRLGDQYMNSGNNAKALEAYRRAVELDANNADYAAKLKTAEGVHLDDKAQKQAARAAAMRQKIDQALVLARDKKFEEAETLMKENRPTDPADLPPYNKVLAEFYVMWGRDRLDRQDAGGAEVKAQAALDADRTNPDAQQILQKSWEGDPTKMAELVEIYRKSTAPEDRVNLADALYRLRNYDEALPLYMELYQTEKYHTKPIEGRVRQMFDMQHRELAQKGDFQGALNSYKNFLAFSPDESTEPYAKYEYMVKVGQTQMDNADQRADLAAFAAERGLTDIAKEEYLNVIQMAPDNPKAGAALQQFAQADLNYLNEFYSTGQYLMVAQKAPEIAKTYAMFPDVVKSANAMAERAAVEQVKEQKSKKQQATLLAQRGDEYYNQGLSYLSTYMSDNVDKSIRVFSPKTEATKYFQLALMAYQQALSIDPSLAAPTSYDLNRKIADAYAKYATLANRLPPPLPSRNQNRMNRNN
ncbi:hypothetical protein CVU37_13225 [candidate division BRC1 bacterium HGW-BRC1-1]|jgi:hypothetical protein|nr:MAG: hypothetical protein CVU37_13225 [candidate division BRC1 bacterium HGW-BRC1-1]